MIRNFFRANDRFYRQRLFLGMIVVLIVLIIFGFFFRQQDSNIFALKQTSTPVIIQRILVDYAFYGSFEEMEATSDLIILSNVMAEKEIQLVSDDHEIYTVRVIYQVQVNEVIKGEAPATIEVINNEGFVFAEEGRVPEQVGREAIDQPEARPLSIGKPYLMFLRKNRVISDQPFPEHRYYPIGYPWLFDISDENRVFPEAHMQITDPDFSPQLLADILRTIQTPVIQPENETTPTVLGPQPATDEMLQAAINSLEPFFVNAPSLGTSPSDPTYSEYYGCVDNSDVGGYLLYYANQKVEVIKTQFDDFIARYSVETAGLKELPSPNGGFLGKVFIAEGMIPSISKGNPQGILDFSILNYELPNDPEHSQPDRSHIRLEILLTDNVSKVRGEENKDADFLGQCPGGKWWLSMNPSRKSP